MLKVKKNLLNNTTILFVVAAVSGASVSTTSFASTAVASDPTQIADASPAPLPTADAIAPAAVAPIDGDVELVASKGNLARVTDEALGFGVAEEKAEIIGDGGGKFLCRMQEGGGSKLGRNTQSS